MSHLEKNHAMPTSGKAESKRTLVFPVQLLFASFLVRVAKLNWLTTHHEVHMINRQAGLIPCRTWNMNIGVHSRASLTKTRGAVWPSALGKWGPDPGQGSPFRGSNNVDDMHLVPRGEVMARSKAADLLITSHAANSLIVAPMGNAGKSASAGYDLARPGFI